MAPVRVCKMSSGLSQEREPIELHFVSKPVSLRPIVCKGRGLQKTDEDLNKTGQTSQLTTVGRLLLPPVRFNAV